MFLRVCLALITDSRYVRGLDQRRWFAKWKCQQPLEPLDFLSIYAITAHEASVNTVPTLPAVDHATPKGTVEQRVHAVGPVQLILNGTHFSVNRLRLNGKIHVFSPDLRIDCFF